MFAQSQRTLDQMYEVWKKQSNPERDEISGQILKSLTPSERHRIEKRTDGWGRGFGRASYINLLLSLILHPTSRKRLEGMWKERTDGELREL